MSNILLRSLRDAGIITGWVLPFARAKAAADLVERMNEKDPTAPRAVIVVDGVNNGDYWVVSEEDAQRLEAKGYVRFVAKPEQDPLPEPPEQ